MTKWAYGTRDRGTRWEYRWRRCPKCGSETYAGRTTGRHPDACPYCHWRTPRKRRAK